MIGKQAMSRRLLVLLALTAAYTASAMLGLSRWALIHPSASAVWPPTGLALGALLLCDYWVWPAIFVGALLANLTTAGDWATSLAIATGNTLEAVSAAWLIQRWAGGRRLFEAPGNIIRFAGCAAASNIVSATVGVSSLALTGQAAWSSYPAIWITWWLGNLVGDVIVMPPLVLWWTRPPSRWDWPKMVEVAAHYFLIVSVGLVVFSDALSSGASYSLAFLCLPALLLTAHRLELRDTATGMLLLAALAVAGTGRGQGPFGDTVAQQALLNLQAFMGVTGVTVLLVSSLLEQRGRDELSLRQAHAELEGRVQERTDMLQQTNRRLRQSEEATRHILETAFNAFIGMDRDGRITEWNAQAEATFGWSRAEAVGRDLAELIIPPRFRAAHQAGLWRYRETGATAMLNRRMEMSALHRRGHEFAVELAIWPTGTPPHVCFHAFVHDITARREMEAKLRQSERLAAIGETIAGLAHESRNALQRSQVSLELLALRAGDRPDLLTLVADVQQDQDYLHQLYEEVRTYAAPRILRRESLDLGQLLRETWQQLEPVRKDRDARLLQTSGGLDLHFVGDRVALGQVFRNLMENALQACRDPAVLDAVWSNVSRQGREGLELSLRDNGPGFAAEARAKAFEPFFTTKTLGTGLGLAIARRLVEAHGGAIALGSSDGQGAEIVITFFRDRS